MKRVISAALALVLAVVCMLAGCLMVDAHSGRTDAQGGHYDRSTGEYHYHHGYPAHQHPNGVCPYEGNIIVSSSKYTSKSSKSHSASMNIGGIIIAVVMGVITGCVVAGFLSAAIGNIKKREFMGSVFCGICAIGNCLTYMVAFSDYLWIAVVSIIIGAIIVGIVLFQKRR